MDEDDGLMRRQPRLVELSRYRVGVESPIDPKHPFSSQPDPFEHEDEMLAPSSQQVEDFVRSLDGTTFDQVLLEVEINGRILDIGIDGSTSRGLSLSIGDGTRYHRLIDPTRPADREEEIPSGGVLVAVRSDQIVPLAAVLQAVRHFIETGTQDPNLAWEADPPDD